MNTRFGYEEKDGYGYEEKDGYLRLPFGPSGTNVFEASPVTFKRKERRLVQARPQMILRAHHFDLRDPKVARAFMVRDMKVGINSQLASPDPVPLDVFMAPHAALFVDTLVPGMYLTLDLENVSDDVVVFEGYALCRPAASALPLPLPDFIPYPEMEIVGGHFQHGGRPVPIADGELSTLTRQTRMSPSARHRMSARLRAQATELLHLAEELGGE